MKPESSLKVFVYGTLKPGEANYHYCDGYAHSKTLAYTRGVLYSLPAGYPAMIEGKNKIEGVLLTFNRSKILESLDRLEGYQPQRDSSLNEYDRCLVSVYGLDDQLINNAWAYFMSSTKVKRYGGALVESNWWTGF